MTEMMIICDRCRQPIGENRTLLRVESGPLRNHYPAGADLCSDCALSWFRATLRRGQPAAAVVAGDMN
jgi:hypothetical protein